ncbi:MAG: CotH kinase family protein [Kiritimatiellia bacterium]
MPEDMSGTVCFGGIGAVAALSATAESDIPTVMQALTVPAADHVVIKSVSVAGKEIEPDANGVYLVEKGSLVTVVFSPETGWALTGKGEVSVVVRNDMAFPTASIPGALNVAENITINEVMAKNGVTLKTTKGFEGLDWVELYNAGDDDLDLTDPNAPYYMGNDPTKATSKWLPIQGSCVVPAHGYKIVWFDGDGLCKDDGFAADEAFVRANLSTDAGKHTVFLASAADKSKIIQQITLPGGVKDVSYGLGHLSRTVVPATATAQVKVGDGAWQDVTGSVGMSSIAAGFQTVEYLCNKQVSNMDVAEVCLADPSSWKSAPVTNTVQHLAFGSGGNFASSLYSNFPAYNADDTILVATGVVEIPRAGDWSFAVGSDDGFTAKLTRLGSEWAWESRGARGYAQSVANFNLEAGAYGVEIVYFNRSGGRVIDFSAAEGRLDFNKDTFKVVGTADCPVVHGGALLGHVANNVKDEMLGKATTLAWKTTFAMAEAPAANDAFRLLLRYTDGFTATLNGEAVVTVPAPGARTAAEALTSVAFAISGDKVVKGLNELVIVSENNAIADTEMLIAPELKWDSGDELFVYSTTPTPGKANAADGKTGFTPKVSFSEAHGYKDAPFTLALSCPDNEYAVIYYTLDGTHPVVGSPSTFRYDAPFEVAKTTVVRAAVPDVDSILQQDASATYLFLADILAADATPPEGFPADKAINSQAVSYGMNQAIVNGDADTQARLRRGFTENCRTISLVIDPKHLFDKSSGIYVNASGNGRSWERPVQVEQINPMDPADEFNVPAGIRIRGAYSRGSQYPKHSFRLFFRSEYGMGTLKHALFGDEGTDSFEKIDLRTEQNYSWANGGNWETFVHEVFARDSQRDMGQSYNRSRYTHLFINGVYWGLYQTEERVDQNYGESYGGGVADNYDVVRTSQPGYNTGVVEGESTAWETLWRITTQEGYGASYPDNYNKVRGLNPDGTRNPDYPVLLNVTNLVCYMITVQFSSDSDSPANASGMANNLAAYRYRYDDAGKVNGFIWNRHDAEHSLSRGGAYSSGTAAILYGTRGGANKSLDVGNFNPSELHYELCANAEYRKTFADLVYKFLLKDGGAMTAAECEKRFRARMAELDDAIVCESARWGGGSSNCTRATWLNNCNDCLNFINKRTPYLIANYQELGWYPKTEVPTAIDGTGAIVTDGMTIGAEDQLYLTVPAGGTVYYTLDGSDPRASETAIAYSGASPVPVDVPVFAKGSTWKYFDEGRLPAENWMAADYDDASWKEGSGRLGFANSGAFATALNRYVGGGSSGTQVTTYYFRKAITLPEGAEKLTTLKAALDCDDGYVAYVNGVEVGRDQVGSTVYEAFSTATDMGEKSATFTFPAGTLKSGVNVIAVEVHQCNATSSDAWWDLALSSLKPGNPAGGLSVPPEGLTVTMSVLVGEEWSPINTVVVKGEMPKSTPAEALRLAAVYSSTLDDGTKAGDGDGSEFVVLTNVTEGVVSLANVKLVAWNSAKKTEADASLTIAFSEATEIMPGQSLTLDKATWFGAKGKLTNSEVGIKLYADDVCIQEARVDASWWNSACDGTGAYFVAKTFGTEALTHADWMPTETTLAGNLAVAELYTSTTGEGGDVGEYIVLKNLDDVNALDLTDVKIVAWNAKKKSEADPSLTIVLPQVIIQAGETLTLDQATYFGDGKLTNSKVGLKVYDPAGVCAQEVGVDATWWNNACDGTGASFEAIEFGALVDQVTQWQAKVPQAADWPEDPETEITEETTPADLGITAGAFATATPTELRKLATWAKANKVPYAGEAVNGLAFADTGYTDFEKAYLLNCAIEEVAEKEAAFKFNAIVPGETPTIEGDFNGTLTIWGATTLENGGDWAKDRPDAHFFKATLTR